MLGLQTMVSYQKWTSVAFEVAKSKGMESSRENSQQLISIVAEIWREQGEELKTATVAEARTVASRELQVE